MIHQRPNYDISAVQLEYIDCNQVFEGKLRIATILIKGTPASHRV